MKQTGLFLVVLFLIPGIACNQPRPKKTTAKGQKGGSYKEPAPTTAQSAPSTAVNLYLENSGSMFGFVEPRRNNYKQAVSQLYHRLKNPVDSINVFTINERVLPVGVNTDGFIKNLSVEDFRQGNPASSDIITMFNEALGTVRNNAVSILLSDGIYTGNTDLLVAAPGLEYAFGRAIKRQNLQTIVVKMSSDFEGRYYRCCDHGPVQLDQERPYYIWIFGNEQTIGRLNLISTIKALSGFEHMHDYCSNIEKPEYSVVSYRRAGRADPDRDRDELTGMAYNALEDVRPARRGSAEGRFRFSVGVDLSGMPVNQLYYNDPDNYACTHGYNIEKITSGEGLENLLGMDIMPFQRDDITHVITLSRQGVEFGTLHLRLKEHMPEWIRQTHVEEDITIEGDTKHTLGFKYLMQGIDKAYQEATESSYLFDLTIHINP